MKKKKMLSLCLILALMIISNFAIATYEKKPTGEKINVEFSVDSKDAVDIKVYYAEKGQASKEDFSETKSVTINYKGSGEKTSSVVLPAAVQSIRIDPGEGTADVSISEVSVSYKKQVLLSTDEMQMTKLNNMKQKAGLYQTCKGDSDPYIVWSIPTEQVLADVAKVMAPKMLAVEILLCIIIDLLLMVIWWKRRILFAIPKEIVENRKLIISLAKNDFKAKFAGSYFGIIWAFVQPVVTIVVYWFVFDKALNSGTQITKEGIEAPFALWLTAGMVPWFYFSEVLSAGSNALVEYNYLVKKVVFKISALPFVKVLSSIFVHVFFVVFMIILSACYGFYPSVYTLQVIYYSFAMMCLCIGIVYATSAMTVFFRDLTQLINILLQVLMWMTPIMWNMDAMQNRISPIVLTILKMNPMYYIVSGYRDSVINHIWFWTRPETTLYFWGVTVVLFMIGSVIFKKLQVHFADVL